MDEHLNINYRRWNPAMGEPAIKEEIKNRETNNIGKVKKIMPLQKRMKSNFHFYVLADNGEKIVMENLMIRYERKQS